MPPKRSWSAMVPPVPLRAAEVLDLLAALVDRSLVHVDTGESGGWFRMLETLRQYAEERSEESGESERLAAAMWCQRHADMDPTWG